MCNTYGHSPFTHFLKFCCSNRTMCAELVNIVELALCIVYDAELHLALTVGVSLWRLMIILPFIHCCVQFMGSCLSH